MRKNFRVHQYLYTFLYRKNGTPNSYFYIGVIEGFSVTSRRAEMRTVVSRLLSPVCCTSGPSPLAAAHVHGSLPCSPAHEKRCIRFARHRSVCAAASHPCRRCDAVVPLPRDSGLLEILPPPRRSPTHPSSCCGASCRSQTLHPRHRPTTTPWLHPSWQCQALVPTHYAALTVASAHVCGMGAEPEQEAGQRTHAV